MNSRIGLPYWQRWRALGMAWLCVLLLSACAPMPPVEPLAEGPWAARQRALQGLQYWSLSGRIGVTDGKDAWHASLYWTQRGQDYTINLIGPLGQGRIHIQGDEQGVRVRTADGRVLSAAAPEQLLEQAIGMRIPVEGLRHWVRGLPDPSGPSQLAGDEEGRLVRLEQDGWIIDYARYTQAQALDLPERIRARQGELQVRLVITQWNLQA